MAKKKEEEDVEKFNEKFRKLIQKQALRYELMILSTAY